MNNTRRPSVELFLVAMLSLALTACGSAPPPREDKLASTTEPDESVTLFAADSEQPAQAASTRPVRVRESSPKQYIVKKGDTLWDIAGVFLKDPWYWPEIWNSNPQVENPHLIYPGDVLTLVYIDGRPQILVNQAIPSGASGSQAPVGIQHIKLSPRVRTNALEADIPSIPGDAIRQFLTRPRVVSKDEYDNAPYILGSEDQHLILGQGNRIYVRGELDKERLRYTVFRPGEELFDPENGDLLGYEAIFAGEAVIDEYADPAKGHILVSEREILIGDRLLPTDKSKISNLYFPKVPDRKIDGRIVSLFDSLFGAAQFQVVVLNKGDRDGVEVGHLFESFTQGASVRDRYAPVRTNEEVKLPDERSGLMMVFRTFDFASYALILQSTNVVQPGDVISTPR